MKRDERIFKPEDVFHFWFDELSEKDWFAKDDALDARIAHQFEATHLALAREVGAEWRANAEARLAAILVLDQFPRNIYRDTPHAFATDPIALREARLALEAGADKGLEANKAIFMYLPFEHSELLADQDRALELSEALGDETYIKYAHAHRDLIVEFGRFPHRNKILARESTPKEIEYLAKPGSGF